MHFRDIICFNQVMAFKQCLKIINNSSFLMVKVLKAKYFNIILVMQFLVGKKFTIKGSRMVGPEERERLYFYN